MARESRTPGARKRGRAATGGSRRPIDRSSGLILSQPEDEPIVIDNPEFAFDVLNTEGVSQTPPGGTTHVTRASSALTQMLVFDSQGKGTEFLTLNLDPDSPVHVFLHKSETPGQFKGEKIEVTVSNKVLTIECTGGTKLAPDSNRETKFRIKTPDPKRGIFSVAYTEKGGAPGEFVLEKSGRHIIFLVPGSPRTLIDLTAALRKR